MPDETRGPIALEEGRAADEPAGPHASRAAAHHPALARLPCWEGRVAAGFTADFLGVRTRASYVEGMVPGGIDAAHERHVRPPRPVFDEEYFEWVDVIDSVREARDRFVMIELGAGYGRWSVRAAAARVLWTPLRFRQVAGRPGRQPFRGLGRISPANAFDRRSQN